jgi:putative membrane protein
VPRLRHRAALASVVGGLLGGLIGAGVMSAGHALITTIAGDGPDQLAQGAQEEDATVKVADRFSRTLRGRPLAADEKAAASQFVHYGFGAVMGAFYGAAAAVSPAVAVGAGSGFGAAVWLGAHAIVVPALGLAPSPLRQPPGKEARELILHLAYGVTVALVWKAAVRTSR